MRHRETAGTRGVGYRGDVSIIYITDLLEIGFTLAALYDCGLAGLQGLADIFECLGGV